MDLKFQISKTLRRGSGILHIESLNPLGRDDIRELTDAVVSNGRSITQIHFDQTDINDDGMRMLADDLRYKNLYLKALSFYWSSIGKRGWYELSKSIATGETNLEELEIAVEFFDSSSAMALTDALKSKTSSLRKLTITATNFGAAEAKVITEALKFGKASIRSLDLSYNDIGKEDEKIFSALNPSLLFLGLNGCQISGDAMKLIIENTESPNSSLIDLNLSNNNLIDEDNMEKISKALGSGKSSLLRLDLTRTFYKRNLIRYLTKSLGSGKCRLQELTIAYNEIGFDGAKQIADVLKSGKSSLKILSLSGNPISDDGSVLIFEALESGNSSLTELYMNSAKVGYRGALALSKLLESGKSNLNKLVLHKNNIDDQGAILISKALEKNKSSLTKLSLLSNLISSLGMDSFINNVATKNSSLILLGGVEDAFLERNKRAQESARKATIQVLLIAGLENPEMGLSDTLFERLIRETGKSQRKHYLIETAKELYNTRFDYVWWTKKERIDAGLEEAIQPKTMQVCISNAVCSRKGKFVESTNLNNVFCSSYCQFIHYTGAPDLRGMSTEEIKNASL